MPIIYRGRKPTVIAEANIVSSGVVTPIEWISKEEIEKMSSEAEIVEMAIPMDRLAHVSTGLSYTKNLGNYESAKLNVQVTYPCDLKDIKKTHKKILNWCEKQVEEFVED